jgi:hypothetical protein
MQHQKKSRIGRNSLQQISTMKQFGFLCLVFISLLSSCKKENGGENPSTGSGRITAPGFGTSTAAFSGANWQLPQGVLLRDSIREASWWTDIHNGSAPNFGDYAGTPGGIFTVCFLLQNTTGQAITISFPQELLILSNTTLTQNGVILLPRTIIIPAHDELVVFANAFCLNLNRSVPDLYTSTGALQAFSFGPAQAPAQLREISELLKTKNLTNSSLLLPNGTIDHEKLQRLSLIQNAVWEATDEDGLTAETKAALQRL